MIPPAVLLVFTVAFIAGWKSREAVARRDARDATDRERMREALGRWG